MVTRLQRESGTCLGVGPDVGKTKDTSSKASPAGHYRESAFVLNAVDDIANGASCLPFVECFVVSLD